jgi:PTS system nitrogen regulatory IIA component
MIEAMDGPPVDLVFLLLAPEGAGADYLKVLALPPATAA